MCVKLGCRLDRIHPVPTIPLKVLAHDDLIGRLIGELDQQCSMSMCFCNNRWVYYEIGKGGYSLKKVATETNTRVNISK
jgi:hypothetical protein